MSKEKLIIIGASYLQIPIIEKAREMGYETHVFAWEKGAEGAFISDFFYPISITEKYQILEYAKRIEPSGIVSIASDLAMTTVNFVANALGLISNSNKCTEVTTNKFLMREALWYAGVPCPKYKKFKIGDQINAIDFEYPVIIKPVDRSGSRGVTKVMSPEDFIPAINRAMNESFGKEVIVEDYISGREISVEMISWKGDHEYLTCTDKITSGEPYFVELEHHQPARLDKQLVEDIITLTKKALDSLKVEFGASHTEIIITEDQRLYLVEVGARMAGDHIGAKLVYNSIGFDYLEAVINICTDRYNPLSANKSAYSGIFFFQVNPGIIKSIDWNYQNLPQVISDKELFLKQGDVVNDLRCSNDRIGYIVYRDWRKRLNINRDDILSIEMK